MQIDRQTNEQITNVLHTAQDIAIIPAPVSGTDALCAGVAMYLMLKNLEKSVKLLYPVELHEGCREMVKESDLISTFSMRQLTISIDYAGEQEAKAWYEPDGQTLKVKLAPVSKDFNPELKVRTKLDSGFDFDTAIIIGANAFEDLGYVYDELRPDLVKSTIINLSNSSKNNRFGSINVIDNTSDSLSNLVIKKAPLWELNINTQAAQALLLGITQK